TRSSGSSRWKTRAAAPPSGPASSRATGPWPGASEGPMKNFGIRFRLGLLLAAFGVLATGLTGLYSFMQSRELLVHAAERDLVSSTQVFGRRLTTVVRGIGDDVRLLSELELTRAIAGSPAPADEGQRAALANAFHAMLRANPAY